MTTDNHAADVPAEAGNDFPPHFPPCADCSRAEVVLLYMPLLNKAFCLPCLREKHPKFYKAILDWHYSYGRTKPPAKEVKP